ncbi:glycosyltransferase [Acinetobacter indicus]|uniref:glycosyltransferase n=1 Tax=Acinetobacter indicus TaxID=756892 RepID=UPI001362248B|nr:glycosyltransferase [Acinetobacter indicus]
MKKIVIISLATYPSQTPRSFRTDELSRELANQGHDVTVYVLTGGYDYSEYSKKNNIKIKSLGDPTFFKYDHKKDINLSFFGKVIRKFFKKYIEFPYIELLTKTYRALNKEKNIDLLITIGAPHPIHWGAAIYRKINQNALKKTYWIADCGDPYMGNSFHIRAFYFKYIEKMFCKNADAITIPIENARSAYYPEFQKKIHVIPQGFDFGNIKIKKVIVENDVPTFIYAGTFYPNLRDPRPLLNYLLEANLDFKFLVYTKTREILKDYEERLEGKLFVFEYLPRTDLIEQMSQADFLLNLENISGVQSPSKLIDYSLAGRPILSLNTNNMLNIDLINDFLKGNYTKQLVVDNIENYNIKNVAKSFLSLSE